MCFVGGAARRLVTHRSIRSMGNSAISRSLLLRQIARSLPPPPNPPPRGQSAMRSGATEERPDKAFAKECGVPRWHLGATAGTAACCWRLTGEG